MPISGCSKSDPPKDNRTCNQATTGCVPACKQARIIRPRGSYSSSSNPTASWLTKPCHHFDFQGVVSGSPGAYVLKIQGQVDPSSTYGCKWTLSSAGGTLSSDTSCTPTHSAPSSSGQGTLKLQGTYRKKLVSCSAQKTVKIYRDHLARDYKNFGTGTSCDSPSWSFTRFGATITVTGRWNCHGGTLHCYNGKGNGSAGLSAISFLLDSSRLKKTVTVTHTSSGKGSHPSLGKLQRGDIVAYFTGSGSLAHTQTCTGNGTETYGANNEPVSFPGRPGVDESWKWATSTAGDWANNIKKDVFPGATPFKIKVFSKP